MTEEYIKKIKILISSGSLFLAIMGIIFFILKLIVLIFNISVNKPVFNSYFCYYIEYTDN